MADGAPIPVRPEKIREWISVLEFGTEYEVEQLIPVFQNLLLCNDELLQVDEPL